MFRTFIIGSIPVAAVALATNALAQKAPFATAAEARAMEERAIAELKANEAAAIAKFNKADGGFRDRDLYVFCANTRTGIFSAHVNPALIGTDSRLIKEQDGSPIGQKVLDAENAAPEGIIVTVGYNFPRPNTTTPVAKESYVTRIGEVGCGVGYYK
jgi:cytochrome c